MQFLSYEQNNQRPEDSYGLMGIATILLEGDTHRFVVKQGKDGQGFYIHPFSQKMNEKWFKALDLDSKSKDDEVKTMIREQVKEHYKGVEPPNSSEAPF